jgi:hypothetical protein
MIIQDGGDNQSITSGVPELVESTTPANHCGVGIEISNCAGVVGEDPKTRFGQNEPGQSNAMLYCDRVMKRTNAGNAKPAITMTTIVIDGYQPLSLECDYDF